jgi:hypothetical protein
VSSEVRAIRRKSEARLPDRRAERRFYLGYSVVLAAAVLLGFSRTFFFRAWFPEWADEHGAPESFFYVHGVLFSTWFLLLVAQTSLVSARRVDLHRGLGTLGSGIAAMMVVMGVLGGLIAAARPTGFMGVPVPPLQFLVVPLSSISLFAIFVVLGLLNRLNPQTHKRCMLLASFALVEAAVARWPFAIMPADSPLPGISVIEACLYLLLVPMVAWDVVSRRRLHPVTLWGGLAIIVCFRLRLPLAGTDTWLSFATWATGLVSAGPAQPPFLLPP